MLPQLKQVKTAGGACPSKLLLVYRDGTLAVKPPDGAGVPSRLKFALSQRGGPAECEHAYAVMSKVAGIRCVETDLIAEDPANPRRHLLVRRFDVRQGDSSHQVLFLSLARMPHYHHQHGRPNLDYRDLSRAALHLAVPVSELHEIARRMLFNALAANPDDHGRNHAFLYEEPARVWSLTPASDVTFHSGMLNHGLRVGSEVRPNLCVMETRCREVGVTRTQFAAIVDGVLTALRAGYRRIRESVITVTLG